MNHIGRSPSRAIDDCCAQAVDPPADRRLRRCRSEAPMVSDWSMLARLNLSIATELPFQSRRVKRVASPRIASGVASTIADTASPDQNSLRLLCIIGENQPPAGHFQPHACMLQPSQSHVWVCAPAAACILFFYDTTKNYSRRWCSMSACGNRMKVAVPAGACRKCTSPKDCGDLWHGPMTYRDEEAPDPGLIAPGRRLKSA